MLELKVLNTLFRMPLTLATICLNHVGGILSLWSITSNLCDPQWAEAKAALLCVDKMIE